MAGKITGRAIISANGQVLLNKEGAKVMGIGESGKPSVEREGVVGDGGVHGYVEKTIIPSCEITITDRDDVKLSDLAKITNGTVIFRAQNGGKSYTLVNAFSKGNFELTAGQGEVAIVFYGSAWVERA